jgi:hypothetical protein
MRVHRSWPRADTQAPRHNTQAEFLPGILAEMTGRDWQMLAVAYLRRLPHFNCRGSIHASSAFTNPVSHAGKFYAGRL